MATAPAYCREYPLEAPLFYSVVDFADRIETLYDDGDGVYAALARTPGQIGKRDTVWFDTPLCAHCERPLNDDYCADCDTAYAVRAVRS